MSKAQIKAKHPPGTSQGHIDKMKELMDQGMEFGPAHNEAERLGFKAKTNPSEEHWLSMNLDFQKGLVKESAIEWAQAVANRDNRPYFIEEADGMWFVTTTDTTLRIDPVKSNPHGGKNCGCGQNPCITYGASTNPPKSKTAAKGTKVSIPYSPGSAVERNLAIVGWAKSQKDKLAKKSKKYSSSVIAFADQKGNSLTFSEILDMQDKAGKKAIPAIMLEDASVNAVFKKNPPIAASKDYSDYSKSTADVMVKLLPDITNLEIENMKATVGSRRAAVELALGKKPSDYSVEGFGTDFVRDDKGQYVPKSLLAYQVLGVRPTRDASMDARFKTQLRETLTGLLGLVDKGDSEVEIGLPFIEEQIFITPGHVADFRQMIKLYHELHERNKPYAEKMLPGLPSKGFLGGIKAIDCIEALLPSPDALFVGEEVALIVPTNPNLLTGAQTRRARAGKVVQQMLDIVTGVRTESPNMDDIASHRKLAAILEREYKGNKKKMATEVCKAVAKAIALYPIGYDAYQDELIDSKYTFGEGDDEEEVKLTDQQRLKGKRFKDEILKATAGNDEYEASLVHIRRPLSGRKAGKKTPFAVIQIRTTGFSSPPIGWDRRWMIPLMQIIHEHWEMLETGGKGKSGGLEIHDLLYLTGIRAKDLFDYEITAREYLIILFLLGAFNTGNTVDVQKSLINTTASAIMEEYQALISALQLSNTNLDKSENTTKAERKMKPEGEKSGLKKIGEMIGFGKDNPPRLMRKSIVSNPPSMSILPITSGGTKLSPSYSYMKKSDLLKVGGVDLTELANLQAEIKKAIKSTDEEDRASVIAMNTSKWKSYVKESTKTSKNMQSKLNKLFQDLKRQRELKEDAIIQLADSKKIAVALVKRYKTMGKSLELLSKEILEEGVTIDEEEKKEIIKGIKTASTLGKGLQNKFKEQKAALATAEASQADTQKLLEKATMELSEADTRLTDLQGSFENNMAIQKQNNMKLKDQIRDYKEEVSKLDAEGTELTSRLGKIQERVQKAAEGFMDDPSIVAEYKDVLSAIDELGDEHKNLTTNLAEVSSSLEAEVKERNKMLRAYTQAEKDLLDAKNSLDDTKQALAISDSDKKVLEDKIGIAEEEIMGLTVTAGEQSQEIQRLSALSETQQREIGELEDARNKHLRTITDLEDVMNKAETDMNAFLNNLEGGRADKVALRDSKTAFKLMGKAIEPMRAALLEVQTQADDLDDEDTARHGLRQMLAASLETMASIANLHNIRGLEIEEDSLVSDTQALLDSVVSEIGTNLLDMPLTKINNAINLNTNMMKTIEQILAELGQIIDSSGIVEKLAKDTSRVMLTKAQAGDLVRLYEQLGGQVKQLETLLTVATNPGGSHDSQGPFKSQTQARQVAKVMSERGEDVYMWDCPRTGGYMVSLNHPTDIAANKVKRFPASSKPNPSGYQYSKTEKAILKALKEPMQGILRYGTSLSFPTNSPLGKLVMELSKELTGNDPYGAFRGLEKENQTALENWFYRTYNTKFTVYRESQGSMYVDNIVIHIERPKEPVMYQGKMVPQQRKHLAGVLNNPIPHGEYHKYEKKVIEILKKEGGAAGLKALRPAFPKKTSKAKAESMLAKMNNVTQHEDGDYILITGIMNNPWQTGGPGKRYPTGNWWEPSPLGKEIYEKSSALKYINDQYAGAGNASGRDVFNKVAAGVERKYGVRYQVVTEREAKRIPYLHSIENAKAERERPPMSRNFHYNVNGNKKGFFVADGGRANKGTWDERNGVVYFSERMFESRQETLTELGHETGAVIIASRFGGKDKIPRVDDFRENQKTWLTHLVDMYTFGKADLADILGINKPKNNPDDEEWDPSVGAPVKKSKTKKSSKGEKEKEEKKKMFGVEVGYDTEDAQKYQILHGRKMDTEDWKDSLERQGYGTNPKGTRMYKGYTIQKTKKGYSVNGMQEFKRLKDARNYIDATKRGATVHPSIVCIYKKNPHKPKCGGVLREQKNKKNYTCMDCGAKYKVK